MFVVPPLGGASFRVQAEATSRPKPPKGGTTNDAPPDVVRIRAGESVVVRISNGVANSWRSRTNARMISILTLIARSLRSTLESIATPCSVNTHGGVRRGAPGT